MRAFAFGFPVLAVVLALAALARPVTALAAEHDARLLMALAAYHEDPPAEALDFLGEDLDAALEALAEARAQLAAQPARSVMLGPIAARIGHRATNAAEAALELAHASEVARGRR